MPGFGGSPEFAASPGNAGVSTWAACQGKGTRVGGPKVKLKCRLNIA